MTPDFYEGAFCGACAATAIWIGIALVRRLARVLVEVDWDEARLAARQRPAKWTNFSDGAKTSPPSDADDPLAGVDFP